jgi:hypothetical protein
MSKGLGVVKITAVIPGEVVAVARILILFEVTP